MDLLFVFEVVIEKDEVARRESGTREMIRITRSTRLIARELRIQRDKAKFT